MSGLKSKRKGSAFENEVAKFLNIVHNTTEFARTPGSGAWMGRSNSSKRAGVAQAAQETLRGDLITPTYFPFIIECKSYNDAPIYHGIIKGPDKHLDKWLLEVEFDAREGGRLPMLWFKTTRKGTFTAIPRTAVNYVNMLDNNSVPYHLVYRDYIVIHQDNYQDLVPFIKMS